MLNAHQLLADVDELVFEGLRTRLPYLRGLHKRSDAMLAIYPGKGSRFAKCVCWVAGGGEGRFLLLQQHRGLAHRAILSRAGRRHQRPVGCVAR